MLGGMIAVIYELFKNVLRWYRITAVNHHNGEKVATSYLHFH